MNNNLQAIILAAGKSTRFNTHTTKLAEPICGQAMILFPTKLLEQLTISTTIVVGYQEEIIRNIVIAHHGNSIDFVTQDKQEGTGHALACSKPLWKTDHILVLNGDVPLITTDIITSLYEQHISSNAAISFVTSNCTDETGQAYGRVVTTDNHIAIVEAKDFIGDISQNYSINAGIYLIQRTFLENHIAKLNDNNASKEFYITDLVKIASENNLVVSMLQAPFNTIRGINTFQELYKTEEIQRAEIISHWMNHGVRFSFPQSVSIDLQSSIGQGAVIGANVHLVGNTIIGKNCIIKEFSRVENTIIEDNAVVDSHCVIKNSYIQSGAHVGPFAHIRCNSTLETNSVVGNFVEVKNSTIGIGSKAKHLSYIGDATLGSNVNIGAGTITCNYDGVNKHRTTIEDDAFIGSNNTLVAPITIGHNAFTAAGSTLTVDVPADALAIARSQQTNKNDYAQKLKQSTRLPKKISGSGDEFSFVGARLIHPNSSTDEQ